MGVPPGPLCSCLCFSPTPSKSPASLSAATREAGVESIPVPSASSFTRFAYHSAVIPLFALAFWRASSMAAEILGLARISAAPALAAFPRILYPASM